MKADCSLVGTALVVDVASAVGCQSTIVVAIVRRCHEIRIRGFWHGRALILAWRLRRTTVVAAMAHRGRGADCPLTAFTVATAAWQSETIICCIMSMVASRRLTFAL